VTNNKLTISRLETALRSHSGANHRKLGSNAPAPAPAAVAVLFNVTNGEPCVLMIKRASSLTHHGGEWAFPGGMIEKSDESPMHAALRETNAELGVDAKDIDVWCGMAPVDTSTGFEVWPYAGRIGDQVVLTPHEREVAEVVNVPVRVFVDDGSKRTITLIRNGSTRTMPAYAYGNRIIWGASARIIANTIDIVNNAA
jgi:8-oxo-dGTP pyrophosphatase MutT (NUDIX family)